MEQTPLPPSEKKRPASCESPNSPDVVTTRSHKRPRRTPSSAVSYTETYSAPRILHESQRCPKWLQRIPSKKIRPEELDPVHSTFHTISPVAWNLRMQTFHDCSHIVDQAIHNLYVETVLQKGDFSDQILQFFHSSFFSNSPYKYKHLPSALVHLPSGSRRDQSHLVHLISRELKNKSVEDNKVAVCRLVGPSGGVLEMDRQKKKKSVVNVLVDVLSQCVALDETPMGKGWKREKKRIRSSLTVVQKLLHWARETEEFQEIIIIVEDPETMPLLVFDAFIATLSHIWSTCRVPIGLILMSAAPQNAKKVLSNITRYSSFKLIVKTFSFDVTLDHLFDTLLKKLFLDTGGKGQLLPLVLSGTCLKKLREYYNDLHHSITVTATQIKVALALHFTIIQSVYTGIYNPSFTSEHDTQLLLFCLDPSFRHYTFRKQVSFSDLKSWLLSSFQRRRSLPLIYSLIQITNIEFNVLQDDKFLLEDFLSSSGFRIFDLIQEKMKAVSSPSLMLKFLHSLKTEVERFLDNILQANVHSSGYSHEPFSFLRNVEVEALILDQINERIVLLGDILHSHDVNCISSLADTSTKEKNHLHQKLLLQEITTWLHKIFESTSKLWSQPTAITNDGHLYTTTQFSSDASLQNGIMAQYRRTVTRALLRGIRSDSCISFRLMEDCRVMERRDLFKEFAMVLKQHNQGEMDMNRFAMTIYELIFCGIIVMKKRGRATDIIEKSAIVWASGK